MKKISTIFFILLLAQFLGGTVSAACLCGIAAPSEVTYPGSTKQCAVCIATATDCKWDGSRDCPVAGGATVTLDNPLGNTTTIPELINKIINAALGVVGSLALLMFIYGGFVWMLASGNEQAVTKGKNILMWATIGLVVIFASYSLVDFIIHKGIGG